MQLINLLLRIFTIFDRISYRNKRDRRRGF